MTELGEVLDRLGLLQYLGRLNDEGFDKWETVLDITEQDLFVTPILLSLSKKFTPSNEIPELP
jgi:hypothetical protein